MSAAEETQVFRMAPKATYDLQVEIESVTRATPRFIVPDWMLEEDESIRLRMRLTLIAARAGVVVHQGIAYALTWDAGET